MYEVFRQVFTNNNNVIETSMTFDTKAEAVKYAIESADMLNDMAVNDTITMFNIAVWERDGNTVVGGTVLFLDNSDF